MQNLPSESLFAEMTTRLRRIIKFRKGYYDELFLTFEEPRDLPFESHSIFENPLVLPYGST